MELALPRRAMPARPVVAEIQGWRHFSYFVFKQHKQNHEQKHRKQQRHNAPKQTHMYFVFVLEVPVATRKLWLGGPHGVELAIGHALGARTRVVMTTAPKRLRMAERTNLSKVAATLLSACSRTGTPGDPGEPRSRPRVAEQLSTSCPGSRHSASESAKLGRTGPNLVRLVPIVNVCKHRPKLASIGQRFVKLDPHRQTLVGFGQSLARPGPHRTSANTCRNSLCGPNLAMCWAFVGRLWGQLLDSILANSRQLLGTCGGRRDGRG